jgi:hypothetical protein
MAVFFIILAILIFEFVCWCLVRCGDERRYGINEDEYPEKESESNDLSDR